MTKKKEFNIDTRWRKIRMDKWYEETDRSAGITPEGKVPSGESDPEKKEEG